MCSADRGRKKAERASRQSPHGEVSPELTRRIMAAAIQIAMSSEPPRLVDAVTAWADAIYADLGQIWPHIEPVANPELAAFFNACVILTPVDQSKQVATWTALHQIGAAWSEFLRAYPSFDRRSALSARGASATTCREPRKS
jgi:hypothetical protein